MNMNFLRPSTIARVIEDAAIGTVRGTARHVRGVGHAIGVEYRARQLANLQEDIEQQAARFASMNAAQREAVRRAQNEVYARTTELQEQRDAKLAKKAAKRAAKQARK